MKIIVSVIASFLLFHSFGQSRIFKSESKSLIDAKDSICEIEENEATDEEFDFLVESISDLTDICSSELKSVSRNRPDELKKSKTLTTLAQLATKAWRGSQYSDKKKWSGIAKHFRRAFEQASSKFNYTKQVSFRLDLVQTEGKSYYHDRKAGITELNLYKGKKPKYLTLAEKEELPDPTPLPYMTEEELLEQFISMLKRKRIITDLKRGKYAYVGINIQVDKNTLNRNKIPTARVVVVMGARRLRNIKVKKRYYVKEE